MANPQVENGYLRIAYEVWEHIMKADLNGSEISLAMAVIRQTWGWKRKETEISLPEFCRLTNQPESTVVDSLKSLTLKKIVLHSKGGGRGIKSKWSFNKDWEMWITQRKTGEFINPTENRGVNENPPENRCQSQRKTGGLSTENRGVSACNPLSPKEQLAPKDSIKDNIKIKIASQAQQSTKKDASKTAHPPDAAYEEFAAEFKVRRTIPYRHKTADFVHLAALRKSLDIEGKGTPLKWRKAIRNFFSSTLSSYTLADLCIRYDCFVNGQIDRFGKPAPAGEVYDFDAAERLSICLDRRVGRRKSL